MPLPIPSRSWQPMMRNLSRADVTCMTGAWSPGTLHQYWSSTNIATCIPLLCWEISLLFPSYKSKQKNLEAPSIPLALRCHTQNAIYIQLTICSSEMESPQLSATYLWWLNDTKPLWSDANEVLGKIEDTVPEPSITVIQMSMTTLTKGKNNS